MINAMSYLRLIDGPAPAEVPQMEGLRLCEVMDKLHPGDTFARAWKSFDSVHTGELVGRRHDGTLVSAPFDGRVIFPNANAEVGEEWFYLAQPNPRLSRNFPGVSGRETAALGRVSS